MTDLRIIRRSKVSTIFTVGAESPTGHGVLDEIREEGGSTFLDGELVIEERYVAEFMDRCATNGIGCVQVDMEGG